MRLLLQGGRVVDPSQDLDGPADLLIEDGKVARIGADASDGVSAGDDTEIVDVSGLVVVPGLIDAHVHLREPGQEYKETVATGTEAAAAGGFTAVACMANTDPVNDSAAITQRILSQAERAGRARVYPVGAISKGMKGEELAEFGEMVEAGIVAVSDDGLPVEHPELMRRAFLYARHYDLPVVQHAEDLRLTADGVMHEGAWSARLGLPGIPGAAEDVMVARDLLLAADTGGRYHVQHLTSGRSLELIRAAKERGVAVTCEVSPHHLTLTDQAVSDQGFSTDTKMKPPLRSERDREILLEGVADGSIDLIATDHAPHHPDEKDVQFSVAPFGVVGLETAVSVCLDRLVHAGVIDLKRFVELLSTNPAKHFGLPGGTLEVGTVADVTLLDLDAEVTIDRTRFRSKGRNTPFHGWTLQGKAVGTILGGRRVDTKSIR